MSTRFGFSVGHSANSIVFEPQLESSNIVWHVLIKSQTNLYSVVFFELHAFIILTFTLVLGIGINYFVVIPRPLCCFVERLLPPK